ncbi:FliI/YscN family ATPase [Albirhodobacter sp. R86504]|uniref:FliI/YscN family ATPase n=1 Tax=Albirhodobacter sp. R86504 TaxID=3093848 RepID=UPI003672CCA3
MAVVNFETLRAEIADIADTHAVGRVVEVGAGRIEVAKLAEIAAFGDRALIHMKSGAQLGAEVLALKGGTVTLLADGAADGVSLGDRVELLGQGGIYPDASWVGRIVDPFGRPLDGRRIQRGRDERPVRASPPPATSRKRLGKRLATGMTVFDTMLPLVRGQRIGLFAGSGVGKSSLLGQFAKGLDADVVVIALIGERGRELREFVEQTLGPEGMKKAVLVAATSDQSPLVRRRCAWAAMTVAEYFRDKGRHVLFLADSVTRFAEAHREVALAGGEQPSLRGYPPSTSHQIMSLAERAGPGHDHLDTPSGDITAIFSVLVAGSDMEEPVADILRGVLDGHVILDRKIAERGRFPAIDLLRSVSRSLPEAATDDENRLIAKARKHLGIYENSEMMIQAGLYTSGSDQAIDSAIRVWPKLDAFIAEFGANGCEQSFQKLSEALVFE